MFQHPRIRYPRTRLLFRWAIAVGVAGGISSPTVIAETGTAASPSAAVKSVTLAESDELFARISDTFEFATAQYQILLKRMKSDVEQPHSFTHGTLELVGAKDWTSGFFPGSLWYLYEYTEDAKWMSAAQKYTRRLESVKNFRGSHDVGFMLNCSYGNGYRLTHDPAYGNVLLLGARSLAARFSPVVGQIRSWDFGTWQYPVIIDNMMNLELLTWAARYAGEPELRDIARQHADNTLKNHFRVDASSVHLVDFDPANGTVLSKQTVQGAADSSAWARGQAWGLYGYTMMFRETRRSEYLTQAGRIARFIMNHPRLPPDKIPYWDFDAPDIPNTPRDASAGAIIAAGLVELSTFVDAEFGAQLRRLARQQLLSLSSSAYLARLGQNGGFLLMHSVGNRPDNTEVDVPLNYADYYFLEALLRYRKSSRM